MGIFDRISRRLGSNSPDAARAEPILRVGVELPGTFEPPLVKLSRTTTFGKQAVAALAQRHGVGDGGYLELVGALHREPDNSADPRAVAVHVDGERIGYLPGHVARAIRLPDKSARSVPVQIFTEAVPKGLRAEAWAWLGQGAPQWEWSREHRPPMSPREKAQTHHRDTTERVAKALADGGHHAAEIRAGMVDGVHFLELVEPIKQLKREGRLDEALELCYIAIEGVEGSPSYGGAPPMWYTEQAAIIHRKLKQRDQEIAVLERWLRVCPPERRAGSTIQQRLDKLVS